MNDLKDYVQPLNKQVVIVKDKAAETTSAGLVITEGGRAKFKSGVIVAFAPDCVNPLKEGIRVGYQLHAGTDMVIDTGDKKIEMMTLNETSITMILKGDAGLGVQSDRSRHCDCTCISGWSPVRVYCRCKKQP